jgi:plasmid stability protein
VKGHKNVTLSLPEPLLRKFRIYAATHDKSMTSLMTEAIRKMVEPAHDKAYEEAKQRLLARLENPPDLGTHGKITWTRDEIHERGVY